MVVTSRESQNSEVAKRTAPETTKRSEVGELVEHRGAVLHIINPHIAFIQKAWNISKNALRDKSCEFF